MFAVILISLCALSTTAPEPAVSPVPVSETELEAFQKNYVDHRLNTAGWSGNFHQEAHSPDLLSPITSDGNLTYRAPASLEMSYSAPLTGQVWIQKDEVGQKFPGRSPQVAAAPMVRSLLEFFRQPPSAWEKDFTQTAQRDHDVMRIQLTVKPNAAAGQPSRIVVDVNALTFDPQRLEIVFAEKASLVFFFTDWQSLGPPSAIPLEPPTHEPTTPSPRPGFRLVDEISTLEPGPSLRGSVWLNPDWPIFRDHFPGRPLLPAVYFAEMGAQTAGALWAAHAGFLPTTPLQLVEIKKFRVRQPALPGQSLKIIAQLAAEWPELATFQVRIFRDEMLLAESEIVMANVQPAK